MSELDHALSALTKSGGDLGRAAKAYGEARRIQDQRHENTEAMHRAFLADTPPTQQATDNLRDAQSRENGAIHDTNVAEDALRGAAEAFAAALAAFQAAVADATRH